MKPGHTLILFLICLLAGGYVYFFEFKGEFSTEEKEAPTLVTEIDPATIERISFSFPDQRHFEIERLENERFEIRQPVQARADTDQLNRILTSLARIEASRTIIPETDSPESMFGFDLPQATVTLWQKDNHLPLTLVFGKSNPVNYSVYLRKNEETTIQAVGDHVLTSFNIDLKHYREQKLLPRRKGEITRVTLKDGEQTIDLIRQNEVWQLKSPLSFRVSQSKMSSLLYEIQETRIEEFLDGTSPEADQALKQPVVEIDISWETTATTDHLIFGNTTADKANRFAWLTSDAVPVLIKAASVEHFQLKPESLIDTKLVLKYAYEYNGLELSFQGKTLSFEKIDGKWHASQPHQNDTTTDLVDSQMTELLSAVTSSEIKEFAAFDAQQEHTSGPTADAILKLVLSTEQGPGETIQMGPELPAQQIRPVWTDNGLPPGFVTSDTANNILEKVEQLIELIK